MKFSFTSWKADLMKERKGMLVLSFPCVQLLDITVKELLESTNITISELYSVVGFQNRGDFTRAFKL